MLKHYDSSTISAILLGNNDPVPRLLDVLDASLAVPLLRTGLEAPAFGLMVGGSKERQAVLQGCLIPGLVSVGSFVVAALWAKSAGASPFISLIFGTSIALFAGRAAARLSTRSLVPRATFRPTTTLQWASDQPSPPRPIKSARRLSPDASNTWGGIFYLLRDIAFFSGWDRPRGPAALYIDAWGIGPPELVQTVEDVAGGMVPPTGLYSLAQGLLDVRTKAISAHLGKTTFTKQEVQDTVKDLVRLATT